MKQERQNFAPMVRVTADALTRPRRSFDHRTDCFEMARIGRETNFDLSAGGKFSDGAVTEMIFHVTVARDQLGNVILTKLGEDDAERFLQKIREHV